MINTNNLKKLKDRIDGLKQTTNKDDWDSDGAASIPEILWDKSYIDAIWFSEQSGLGLPFICPCTDGTVHLNWSHEDGREFVIELLENQYDFDMRFVWAEWVCGYAHKRETILDLLKKHML